MDKRIKCLELMAKEIAKSSNQKDTYKMTEIFVDNMYMEKVAECILASAGFKTPGVDEGVGDRLSTIQACIKAMKANKHTNQGLESIISLRDRVKQGYKVYSGEVFAEVMRCRYLFDNALNGALANLKYSSSDQKKVMAAIGKTNNIPQILHDRYVDFCAGREMSKISFAGKVPNTHSRDIKYIIW